VNWKLNERFLIILDTDYSNWVNIVKAMKYNKRPTIHGTLLRGLDLNRYTNKDIFNEMTDYKNYKFDTLTKDYLLKKDGSLRGNVYLAPIDVLVVTNYLCFKIFELYQDRENVFYSGNFNNFDMFYKKQYSRFQKDLLSIYSQYDYYMKVDIKNFYGNISLDSLVARYEETCDLVCFLKQLGLNEFPIFQDCSGLSYIATRLFLEDVDSEILSYIRTIVDKPYLIRYSDDLYILFNQSYNLEDMTNEQVQSNIKKDLDKILEKYGLKLNEKFSIGGTLHLPEEVITKLYDFYVPDEDFDILEKIGGEVEIIRNIKKYIYKLSQVKDIEEYNALLSSCFSYKDNTHNFEKNLFNEVLYDRRLNFMIQDSDVINIMMNTNITINLWLDPVRITLLILFSRCEQLIKKFLHTLYLKLENDIATQTDVVALLTYISQRDVTPLTRRKIINKLAFYDNNLSVFLGRNLS